MQPTEHELTVAVDAAARTNYEIARHHQAIRGLGALPAFDDLDRITQNNQREAVLRVITAVLEALPDRAEAERRRIGTFTLQGDGDSWCHHDRCAVSTENGGHDVCTCGLDELLEQLREVPPL